MDLLSSACRRLESRDETLTLLNLSCTSVGSEGVVKLSKSCTASNCRQRIRSYDRDHNPNKNHSVTPLVALWLEGNEIYVSGAKALRSILVQSPRLKYLYLANNHIGNEGTSALVPVAFPQLSVCNLSDNEIGVTGAMAIAECLIMEEQFGDPKNDWHGAKTLILANNRIGDEGAKAIASSLRRNNTLKHLDLRYNRIGMEGLLAFRDVLKEKGNTCLEYMILEEEQSDDVDVACTRRPPPQWNRKNGRIMAKRSCFCDRCGICYEIEYYLALNRAGRRFFHDTHIGASLWASIFANVTNDEPSLLYTMLVERPDIPLRR